MLVLSRRHGEQILVGDNVVIKVLGVTHGRVRVGIEAPRDVHVRRSELLSEARLCRPGIGKSEARPALREWPESRALIGQAHSSTA